MSAILSPADTELLHAMVRYINEREKDAPDILLREEWQRDAARFTALADALKALTQADVTLIRDASAYIAKPRNGSPEIAEALECIADKIAALLPS